MRAALFAWLNRFQADQPQREGQTICPNRPNQCPSSTQDSGVKITLQFGTPQRKRTSRYLCERDRWEIIRRIDDGEQQATLAKEFDVSRAAVCNLYKNRSRVLNRGVSDMKATHPKKPRKRSTNVSTIASMPRSSVVVPMSSSPDISSNSNEAEEHTDDVTMETSYSPMEDGKSEESRPFLVHEASAHSHPCRNLVAALRDENISTTLFRQRTTRLARLLIEEALACLPHNSEDVRNQYGDICSVKKTLEEHDICGVSMEGRGSVLLQAFSDISPASIAGIVSVYFENNSDGKAIPHVKSHLPVVHHGQVVVLLDIECTTGNEACAVLHHIVNDKQIAADKIYYVTILSSFESLLKLSKTFPGISLITAQMDTVLDQHERIRPGFGNFKQRYWEAKASPFV
ncbi:hypothetical protein PHMEG_0001438 [Phytophthora megakarya]|uniref:Uncharacterized protein n=1 Tax=Phytophthora megakarya TaxID=4795 RepID=A0A225X0K8_9STRA|nr:hypothetical protein PHMEG_0001438 [Phytophthora megakarya]